MIISKEDYLNNLLDSFCKYEEKLNILSNKAYPSDTVKKFIENDLKMIITEFKEIAHKDLNNNKDYFSEKTIIANYIWEQEALQKIAKAVANTDFKSHPLEIMNVFRDLIKDIEKNDFEILTIPREEMNFSFNEIWFKLKIFLEKELNMNDFTVDRKFIRLTFPKNHKNNLLMSGIFFHEIGHYLVEENNLADRIFQNIDFSSADFLSLKKCIYVYNGNQLGQVELINIFKGSYLTNWIKELLSDILAVYTVGPAFIFSMFNLVINSTSVNDFYNDNLRNIHSLSHPSFSFRFELILKALKELEIYNELPKLLKDKIKSYQNAYANSNNQQPNRSGDIRINNINYRIQESKFLFQKLEKIISDLIPDMLAESERLLGDSNIINKDKLDQAEKFAEQRIKEVIPPNELNNTAADPIAIINSGWYAKLLYKNSLKKRVGKTDGKNGDYDLNLLINDLMKYSLRTSRIQRRWQD